MSSASQRYYLLGDVAAAAFAGEHHVAKEHANELLSIAKESPRDWYYGNAVHQAWIVLGHIALSENELAIAQSALVNAAQVPGSPQLNSFGPNMMLAKLLMERGSEQPVLEYLKLCKQFWDDRRIDSWIDVVEKGGIPRFGANLRYYWNPSGIEWIS